MESEMERDSSVFVYGLDVTDHKGIFGTTLGLEEKFGRDRCFITPLSEDAMTGFALGAAINGLRPIHIHQRVDFMLLGMNQFSNMYSSCRYMSDGMLKAPIVVRGIIGRGWGQSCQHSKSMHSVLAHIPGLKVIMPTSPRDAKGLLTSAIRDNNPVICLEHRWLYDIEGDVPAEELVIPLGKARIVKQGIDLTIVATSWMNIEALKATEIIESNHNVRIEIIDPRTIYPLDTEAVVSSVQRTGHCIIADYDWVFCGFSAEVAAVVSEQCFSSLKSPVSRIGFAHTPCPTTRSLEQAFYPNSIDIIRLIEKKLDLPETDISKEEFYSYENKFKGPF